MGLLVGGLVPYRPIVFESVGSTNDIAMEAARAGAEGGLVVQARRQARGKGRKARDWGSPRGGLWMSVVLASAFEGPTAGLVPLAVGCACCRALRDVGMEAQLRWPNDLMVEDEKIGGILVESSIGPDRPGRGVAGIGINVQNDPPVEEATSVKASGSSASVRRVRDAILDRLPEQEAALEQGRAKDVCNTFMRYAWGIGREMLLDDQPCRPKEIAVDGALIVETLEGEIQVHRSGSLRVPEPS